MRTWRTILVVVAIGVPLLMPTAAAADGGSYIEFDQTHYLPGETAVGEAYIYVPQNKQGLLERGPFFAFLLTDGASIRKGKPIPDHAVRLGSFTVEPFRGKKWFEMEVSFTVPDLAGDFYSIAVCNDPCTIVGFRESLYGQISVVQTIREGELITAQQRLQGRIYSLRRTIRKDGKRYAELEEAFDANDRVRSQLATQVSTLQDQVVAPAVQVEEPARPVIDTWVGVMVAVTVLVLAVVSVVVAAPVRRLLVGRYGVTRVQRDPDRRAP